MKIRTFGNKGNEAVLLLHPMFTSAEFFDAAIDQLKNYYLIVPTYSDIMKIQPTYPWKRKKKPLMNS